MMTQEQRDHLFREHHGRMVSTLTRIFGLENLETIEDAVQDTFLKVLSSKEEYSPSNTGAWLIQAAKNRTLDILKKNKSDNRRIDRLYNGVSTIAIDRMFLDSEIEDNQLRMIFTACHPLLDPRDQIVFALKTLSGFSIKEISAALLTKEDTIKKRLQRTRKVIAEEEITFEIPQGRELRARQDRVHEILYLIFNEGYHSTRQDILIRRDLCSEAMRMCKLLLKKDFLRQPSTYALLALMCFHAARLEGRISADQEIVTLIDQDRTKWSRPLIEFGNGLMNKAVEGDADLSVYHYEAAIAAEHIRATTFEKTNWKAIYEWYDQLDTLAPSTSNKLNKAIVLLQMKDYNATRAILDKISARALGQRAYLLHATWAEYYKLTGRISEAKKAFEEAIALCRNNEEQKMFQRKIEAL